MKIKTGFPAFLLTIILVCAVIIFFFTALNNMESESSSEDIKQLDTAIRRAAVTCYSVEGRYPENLDYLIEHYGLQIDDERYFVDYEVFASNIAPSITVLERVR